MAEQLKCIGVVAQHQRDEVIDPLRPGALHELLEQRRGDAVPLPGVADHDRDLRFGWIVAAHEARHADDHSVLRIHRRDRLVIVVVDLGQVAQVLVAEALQRREEAPVSGLRAEPLEGLREPRLSSERSGRSSSSRPSATTTCWTRLGHRRWPPARFSSLRLDQAAADRIADQLDTVAHPELSHRIAAVILDRLLGEMKDLGDLARRMGLGDELDDFLLARREVLVGLVAAPLQDVLDQGLLGGRGEERLAALHRTDCLHQIGVGLRLQHVAGGAGPQRLEEVALVVVHGQDQDGDLGRLALDLTRCLQPGQLRHPHVEDREVGALADRCVAGLRSVRRFADHLDVGLALEQQPQTGADDPVIVGD